MCNSDFCYHAEVQSDDVVCMQMPLQVCARDCVLVACVVFCIHLHAAGSWCAAGKLLFPSNCKGWWFVGHDVLLCMLCKFVPALSAPPAAPSLLLLSCVLVSSKSEDGVSALLHKYVTLSRKPSFCI